MNKKYKKVVLTGVFEILHPGHILFLQEAKKLGDELTVIIGRDKRLEKSKRKPVIPEDHRLEVLRGIKGVDRAILGDEDDIFKPIMQIKPDIIALGKNQHFDEDELKRELERRGLDTKVVRLNKFREGGLNSSGKIIEAIIKSRITRS